MNEAQRRFVDHLERQIRKYRSILEGLFGKCDPRFVFGTVVKSTNENNVPQTYFRGRYHTNGNCVVDIHISEHPWENCVHGQGTWQVAHECVHLLDPGIGGTANVLEEGLATWFQDEPCFHDDKVRRYIQTNSSHSPPYHEAKQLVLRCMPELIAAVKELRASGIRIRDITADRLASHLPNVDHETIKRLCDRF